MVIRAEQCPWIPHPPTWQIDWQAILAACQWLLPLREVLQNPHYHAEGDVLIHTRMVAEALVNLPAWRAHSADTRAILFLAALFHDIGKVETTRQENGRWVSPGHARAGTTSARWLLRTSDGIGAALALTEREAVAVLVALHGLPLQFLDRDNPAQALIAASYRTRLDLVALLAEADVLGRICVDQAELLSRVALFRSYAEEQPCLEHTYTFASDHSRVRYLRGMQADPHYHAYDDTWGEVTLLAGLPGVGKDTWLAGAKPRTQNQEPQGHGKDMARRAPTEPQSQGKGTSHRVPEPHPVHPDNPVRAIEHNLADLPVIALDAIRADLGIDPTEPQGQIIQAAKEQARELLRKKQPFVWNATNLTRQIRDPLVDLFLAYHARVRIVYLDAPLASIRQRNAKRLHPVPDDIILRLARKAEPPTLLEAHWVEWYEG